MHRVVVVGVVVAVVTVGCANHPTPEPRAPVAASATTAGTTPPSSADAAVAAAPGFHGSVALIDARTRARMRYSWRRGCPVGLRDLRLVSVDHWGFDRRVHRGELVVHRRYAQAVVRVAGRPYANRARRAPGMVHEGDATVRAFASIGWGWGGRWRSGKDYQHFSASGR